MRGSPERHRDRGIIFNIQRFSLHDGPGIRTTVFMKGCPLRCQWCSNPESMNLYPELMTNDVKCIKCGTCIEACPRKAITLVENIRTIDRSKCDLCMVCTTACPSGAIESVGKYMSVEEVVKEIEKDRLFYQNSGGGVTFSGGEPLVQWQFLREICKQCKQKDVSIALDTTGYAPWNIMEKVLEYVDLVLYDIKHLEPHMHIEGTGVSNELILENVRKTARKVRTWLRIPVIPDFNDSMNHISRLAEFSVGLGVEKVSLLPYHMWGVHKYERLGRVYPLKGVQPLPPELLEAFKKIFESNGLITTVGV